MTQSEATSAEADAILYKKIILCWFIVHLPDEGVLELIESVKEIWEFYDRREEDETPLLPVAWKVKTKFGKTYTRPVFPIIEDEG